MKKRNYLLLAMMALGLSLTACSNGDTAESKVESKAEQAESKTESKAEQVENKAESVEKKVSEEAKAKVQEIKGDAIKQIVEDKKEKENYLIIDVRSAEEYAKGHINFAINMPLESFKEHLAEIEDWKDKNIIVYCNSGRRSGEAADILIENGFKKVFNGEGVKNFQYDLKTVGNIRGKELMEKASDALVVDAREAKDFEKEHFKTAVNVNADDPATIDAILPDNKDTLIITHCYSGNRSAKVAEYIAGKGYSNVWNCLDGTKEYAYDFSQGDKESK